MLGSIERIYIYTLMMLLSHSYLFALEYRFQILVNCMPNFYLCFSAFWAPYIIQKLQVVYQNQKWIQIKYYSFCSVSDVSRKCSIGIVQHCTTVKKSSFDHACFTDLKEHFLCFLVWRCTNHLGSVLFGQISGSIFTYLFSFLSYAQHSVTLRTLLSVYWIYILEFM